MICARSRSEGWRSAKFQARARHASVDSHTLARVSCRAWWAPKATLSACPSQGRSHGGGDGGCVPCCCGVGSDITTTTNHGAHARTTHAEGATPNPANARQVDVVTKSDDARSRTHTRLRLAPKSPQHNSHARLLVGWTHNTTHCQWRPLITDRPIVSALPWAGGMAGRGPGGLSPSRVQSPVQSSPPPLGQQCLTCSPARRS